MSVGRVDRSSGSDAIGRPPSQALGPVAMTVSRVPTAARQLRISNRIPWPVASGTIDSGANDTRRYGDRSRKNSSGDVTAPPTRANASIASWSPWTAFSTRSSSGGNGCKVASSAVNS